MPDIAVAFLGVIALAAVVQCAFIVLAAKSLQRTGARVNDLCQRFDAELKPALEDLRKGAANLRQISDSGREQAARIETLLTTTIANIETTVETVRAVVVRPLSSLSDLSAFWGGLRRGLETYKKSAPPRRTGPVSSSRRPEDSDEHLFIG